MADEEVRFGPFRLLPATRELSRNDKPVRLGARALEILRTLAAARGDVVTKDAIMASVWPDQIVADNALQVQISALRKALDEERTGEDFIVTVPGRGYRLIGLGASEAGGKATPDANIAEGRSIAVLPFQNTSNDPGQDYFADGMVEEIIAGLARITWLDVIARNSTFIYKGKAVDVKQVGHDLNVRYVLEGSVRQAGDRIRVTAQLIDAKTGIHLWVERYDRRSDDIFALQDDIAMDVVGTLEPNLRNAELERIKRKRPDSLDAYDLVLQAMPFAYSHMPEKAAVAIPLLSRALEIEPGCVCAHAPLALCYHARYGRAGLAEQDRRAAVEHAHAAMIRAGDDAISLGIAGFVVAMDERDFATALQLFDRALTLSNSNALSFSCSALALAWLGRTSVSIDRALRALRLSPFDSLNYLAHNALAISHFHLGAYDASRDAARKSIQSNPQFGISHAFLAAALIRCGRDAEANSEAREAIRLDPNFTISRFSAAVGLDSDVFRPFADAWREVGIPAG
jgi:TolB-like protein/Tfp pilus assembly protein PilF